MIHEIISILGIVVSVVNTIVGIIGIVISCIILKKEHQKSNRSDQS